MVRHYKVVKKGMGKDEKAPVEDRLKYLEASAELGGSGKAGRISQ